MPIEEEVSSMLMGSSLVPNKKRGAHWPKFPIQKKRTTQTSAQAQEEVAAHMGPSTSSVEDSSSQIGVSMVDIPGYVPPCRPDVKPRNPMKNQRYPVRMPTRP